MPTAPSPFFRDTSFDLFLFAAVGEERNGMLLSVLSALARLDVDPWREAASLSKLPAPAASARLTSLLTSLPGSQLDTPAPATIMRLVGLLPRAARDEAWPRGVALATRSRMSWPIAVCLVFAFLMMCAEQFVERRASVAPSGAASSATSATTSGAAKARRE
jgi:hypothetical protein